MDQKIVLVLSGFVPTDQHRSRKVKLDSGYEIESESLALSGESTVESFVVALDLSINVWKRVIFI